MIYEIFMRLALFYSCVILHPSQTGRFLSYSYLTIHSTQKTTNLNTLQEHLGRCLRYPTPSIQEGQRICRRRNCGPGRVETS